MKQSKDACMKEVQPLEMSVMNFSEGTRHQKKGKILEIRAVWQPCI